MASDFEMNGRRATGEVVRRRSSTSLEASDSVPSILATLSGSNKQPRNVECGISPARVDLIMEAGRSNLLAVHLDGLGTGG
jgi:hypothetical protein